MKFDRRELSNDTLKYIYRSLIKPRLIEEKMLILLRQGRIAKWFSGIGQEAVSVGVGLAMQPDEYILPMHRNLGIFTTRNIPLHRLFSQWMGKPGGFTKGRDRSFHFGTQKYKIIGMISHLGPQLGIADGIALGNLLKENNKITAVFSGDGGASEGDFHEALNVAAVWNLPVIFIVENNGYGLSTPSNEQFKFKQFIDKGIGYGMKAVQVDGNNILDVYHAVTEIAEAMHSNPHPVLLECMTFRMRGHEEASGTKYVPQELFEIWGKKDPVVNYESFLISESIITTAEINQIKKDFKDEIDSNLEITYAEDKIVADTQTELADMYAPFDNVPVNPRIPNKTEKRFVDALSDGLKQAMQKHNNLVIMGQDIAEYGGVFKVTQGFVEEFGLGRVRNTPLCESAIVGAAQGLSINGFKAIVEMQFADFVTCGFNQIVNNLAKTHYRWGQNVDVVVRMPTGAAVGAGPFHSQSTESWFFHVPGLKILYPSFPSDAKGLIASAIEDPNPVMFFEHKALYRNASVAEEVYDDYYTIEIGKAKRIATGNDITIVSYGLATHWAMEALQNNSAISADLIDLRSLLPWDEAMVLESVKKTGKCIVLNEDTITGSISAEIASVISDKCFQWLDAPVKRVGALDTPVPMNENLEWNFLPKKRFEEALIELWNY